MQDIRGEILSTFKKRQEEGRVKGGGASLTLDVQLVGWEKTPQASDAEGGVMEIRPGTTGKYKLLDFAQLAGWATATASKLTQSGDLQNEDGTPWNGTSKPYWNGKPVTTALGDQVKLVGFPTTSTADRQMETPEAFALRETAMKKKNPKLGGLHMKLGLVAQLAGFPTTTTRDSKLDGLDGPNRTGSPSLPGLIRKLFYVPTGMRVVLAPEFSLWLMGFPEAWVTAAPGAKDWQEAQAKLALEC